METVVKNLKQLSQKDRARIQRLVSNQSPMSDDEWENQVKSHTLAGRSKKIRVEFRGTNVASSTLIQVSRTSAKA